MKYSLVFFIILHSLLSTAWATETTPSTLSPTQSPTTQTIYYFDKDWKAINHPDNKGFYRKLLQIDNNGFLIQDFYQTSNQKQSNPIRLKNQIDLAKGAPQSIDGLLILWHENGQKSMEVQYKDGQKQGILNSWYENGNKELEQNYLNDKENGFATYWNKQGQKELVFHFENGNLNTLYVWKNDKKLAEKHFKAGKKEGISTYWYDNGNKKTIATYHNDQLNGLYTSFYPNGQKQTEFIYKDNDPIQITLWYKNNKKAAYLKKIDGRQTTCNIWDEEGSIAYEGKIAERCILTIRNIKTQLFTKD